MHTAQECSPLCDTEQLRSEVTFKGHCECQSFSKNISAAELLVPGPGAMLSGPVGEWVTHL